MNDNYPRRIAFALVVATLLLTSAPRVARAVVDRYWVGNVPAAWSGAFNWKDSGAAFTTMPNDGTARAIFNAPGAVSQTSNIDVPWSIDGLRLT